MLESWRSKYKHMHSALKVKEQQYDNHWDSILTTFLHLTADPINTSVDNSIDPSDA